MRFALIGLLALGGITSACSADPAPAGPRRAVADHGASSMEDGTDMAEGTAVATFAGGCFWCMEPPFEKLDGVTSAVSGYTGGHVENPTYEQVCTGRTGHLEAVEIRYDPRKVSYRKLLEAFWRNIDPTDAGGQFADRGSQYETAIFYHDEMQRRLAETTKAELAKSGLLDGPIATKILPAKPFYRAEEHHQDFCVKQPQRYGAYRVGSGRAGFLDRMWEEAANPFAREYEKPTPEQLAKRLTPTQCDVTQEGATEKPFDNPFWNEKRAGIYVDVVTGEPLFASVDKFESGTGWPSFTRPIEPDNVVRKADRSHGMVRVEVRSKHADSHLGHLFDDGPGPGGLRYCINSAALRFIPVEDLEKEGYGEYRHLFRKSESDGTGGEDGETRPER